MHAPPSDLTGPGRADVLARLREGTAEAHAALEARLDVFGRVSTRPGRLLLVQRFWGLHRGCDAALEPWLAPLPGLDFANRRREPHLVGDLRALGCLDVSGLAACPAPPITSLSEALGLFYVLEGSTLGGRVIRRELERSGSDMTGLSFLDPYGEAVGPMWKRLVAILEQQSAPCYDAAVRDTVQGARSGFHLAQSWLCGNPDA